MSFQSYLRFHKALNDTYKENYRLGTSRVKIELLSHLLHPQPRVACNISLSFFSFSTSLLITPSNFTSVSYSQTTFDFILAYFDLVVECQSSPWSSLICFSTGFQTPIVLLCVFRLGSLTLPVGP
jgi:hypothetical protein